MKSKETVLDTLWRNQNIWLWFIFFFLMEEGTLNCCLSVGPAVSRAVSEPRVDTLSWDYLPSAAQTTASLPEAMGNSTGRSFSFPQHLLSHFHACVAVQQSELFMHSRSGNRLLLGEYGCSKQKPLQKGMWHQILISLEAQTPFFFPFICSFLSPADHHFFRILCTQVKA